MQQILEKLFDLKRIPTKLLLVLCVSASILLFASNSVLAKLNLESFKSEYGKYIGITFVLTAGFIVVSAITTTSRAISRARLQRKIRKSILENIANLDFHERALLREFYINGKYTIQLPFDNDTVVGLANKYIIYQASNTGFQYVYGMYFPFTLSETVKKNLRPEMIDLPANTPTEDEKRKIANERPTWALKKAQFDNRFSSRW